MDIRREIKAKPFWRKYWYALPAFLLVSAALFLQQRLGDASFIVDQEDLQLATVERGEFKVEVRGVGVLKPEDIRWESAQVDGRVEQLLVKPGAKVSVGQALLKLSNPDLHRELERAKWELKATEAESHAAHVLLESQILDLENHVEEAYFTYQSNKLRLDAETELLQQGRGSISMLDYERTQLTVKQNEQRWMGQKKRAEKMRANLQANKLAQEARLGLIKNNVQRVTEQIGYLTVRASIEGVLQQIPVQLGQQTDIGNNVALIANQQSLVAELQVQELQMRDVAIGQTVVVDTRKSLIAGTVARIDPAVDGGMVQVDVQLVDALPKEARPDLNVEGVILVNRVEDALFVRRPAFAPQNSETEVFRVSGDHRFASKQRVNLGQMSVNHIQIFSGLEAGDSIIISDTSAWQQHAEVLIN